MVKVLSTSLFKKLINETIFPKGFKVNERKELCTKSTAPVHLMQKGQACFPCFCLVSSFCDSSKNIGRYWIVYIVFQFKAITLVTVTGDSHYCTCLSHLGQRDTDRIVSIFCHVVQGGTGKYCFM
jgi:hypothetical protein